MVQNNSCPIVPLKVDYSIRSLIQYVTLQEVSLKEKLSEAGQRKRLDSVGALSRKKHSPINGKLYMHAIRYNSNSMARSLLN